METGKAEYQRDGGADGEQLPHTMHHVRDV